MKSKFFNLTLAALMGLLTLTLAACGGATPAPATVAPTSTIIAEEPVSTDTAVPSVASDVDITSVDQEGNTVIDNAGLQDALNQSSAGELSEAESQGIVFMREEEKLARDVYLTLYEKWNLAILNNIASAEQTHMEAVKTLMDRYGLDDPAADQDVGEFTNQDLQTLYDQLVEQGSKSLVDALNVGAAIEEIDILDLQKYLAQTDKADIEIVYESLMKGSRNHLRSFVSVLKKNGETYQPQYLSQDAYDAIVNTPIERGR